MSNVQNAPLDTTPRSLDLDEAADAILGRWSDGDEDLPSEDDELEASDEALEEETDEAPEDETEVDEDTDEDDEEEGDPDEDVEDDDEEELEEDGPEMADDTLVDILVDGETKKASLKDLKRLYGQEASLTRKSQQVATQRKEAESSLARADASYKALLERAEARWKPYADVDMLIASRNLSAEDFAQLRQEAKAAEDDLRFLREEAGKFYEQTRSAYQAQLQEAAKECTRVLQQDLDGWGNDLYNEIRAYAVQNGLPQEQVDQYVDPNVIKILNKARLYDQMKLKADKKKQEAKVTTNKSKAAKTKTFRSKKAPPSQGDINYSKLQKASEKLRSNKSRSGDIDDIADAIMARWER